MIVQFEDLVGLRRAVIMVDGCFDPLHRGHIEYFRRAAEFGPLLCNIASDDYLREKHAPLLAQRDRAEIIDSLRQVTYTHPSTVSTSQVLRQLQPLKYVKGADWKGRLPVDQLETAAEHGIEIVFVETVLDSSGAILRRFLDETRGEAGRAER